jgi:D-serine deaminase-like pyridoxal phosphate-dependent protein
MDASAVISTPALVVDLDVFDENVRAMASLLRDSGTMLRPHVKTHRTPELARRQLGDQVTGVTCSTVGEAEAMVAAGITDVFVANEVVDPDKIRRLVALGYGANVRVAVDDAGPVAELARLALSAGTTIGVLVDVDIRLRRCGVASVEEAVALGRAVADARGLRLDGIMGYEGRIRGSADARQAEVAGAYAILRAARDAFLGDGLPVAVVSAAGTSTLLEALADPTITEIQAGAYALMEPELLGTGLPFRCAAAVRGTVISRHPGRIVLDVGRRSVGMEYGPPIPVGLDMEAIWISDEHTTVTVRGTPPRLGSRWDLVPAQIRTTFNLHDHAWILRSGAVVDRWPVAARGRSD